MKRRGSLFRRTTEASSALEWIEDCMMNTDWWIHVQNSMEVCRTVAPTPPASPQSQISVWEIASPRAEDRILDCALMFRKMKNTQQFVLLSNDITLKIKAMAEVPPRLSNHPLCNFPPRLWLILYIMFLFVSGSNL